jgi:hypothetical protein
MAGQIYEVNINTRAKGTRRWLFNPRETPNENVTGCFQKHVVLGYERTPKPLFLNLNITVLQIIPREHDLISITGREKFAGQMWNVPIRRAFWPLVAGIPLLWVLGYWLNHKCYKSELDEDNIEIFNIINARWKDQRENIGNDTERLSHKNRLLNWAVSNSSELKQITSEFHCILIVRLGEIYSNKISRYLSSAEQVVVVQKERGPAAW